MRKFNKREETNMAYLVDCGIEFTLVQTTETGLKKGIMDATAPMRAYFLEKEIHDFASQQQGEEHKRLLPITIYDATTEKPSTMSIYRPNTKKGDPRIWIYGLKKYSEIDDIHAITFFDGQVATFNITRIDIPAVCNSPIITPFKDFVDAYRASTHSVSDELLGFFRSHQGEWFENETASDTGIGRAIETMLGIPMNAKKTPDYKGIELKSDRDKRNTKKNTLFSQVPDWSLSAVKSTRELVEKYGYPSEEDPTKKTLQNDAFCGKISKQNLTLTLNQIEKLLELQYVGRRTDDVAVWTLMTLHNRLAEKHRETFWITVNNKIEDSKEYFQFKLIEHTKNPILSQFDVLLDNGLINLSMMLCRPSGNGDTYAFKIQKKALPLLFPESVTYQIL